MMSNGTESFVGRSAALHVLGGDTLFQLDWDENSGARYRANELDLMSRVVVYRVKVSGDIGYCSAEPYTSPKVLLC